MGVKWSSVVSRSPAHGSRPRALAGLSAGGDTYLLDARPVVGQEVAELAGLAPVLCQSVQAHGPVVLHRGDQLRPDPLQTCVAELSQTVSKHANCARRMVVARIGLH